MRGTKNSDMMRVFDKLNDFGFRSGLNESLRPITKSPAPVIEDTSANPSLKPQVVSERKRVDYDIYRRGKCAVEVPSISHNVSFHV
jgi:hypothetical protein